MPAEGAMILAPNHASYLDPIWVSIPIHRPLRYMTWDKMTRLPLIGHVIKTYGSFPVKTDGKAGDRAALRLSLEHLRSGGGLMIFPEGARTRTGKLLQFKPGVIRLALDTNVPIIPVTIIGGYKAFAPHHRFPRPYKVRIVYHKPISLNPSDDRAHSKEYQREEIEKLQLIVASGLPNEDLPLGEQHAMES